jgi:regulator of sigma E protease
MNTALYIVPFLFVLSLIVFVHEYGHFIVGRWCGVKVDAFSMGFGPELGAFVDGKGTRWRVAAIPLGGYVKFHGDANGASAPDDGAIAAMPEEEREVTFAAQPVWERMAIVFAGPFANFLLAIAIFTGLFATYGKPLMENGQPIVVPRIVGVAAGSAAEAAGFKPGDAVLSVDGVAVSSFNKFQSIIVASPDKPLTVVVRREGAEVALQATPRLAEVDTAAGKKSVGRLGVTNTSDASDLLREQVGVVRAAGLAVEETWLIVDRTFHYLGGLFSGRESADQLSGPIGIAEVSGQVAKDIFTVGVWPFLNLIAILSISIGLLNLMPVPLLDGGHLVFYAIEWVRGRALNERTQEFAFRIGLAMVGTLMIFSTYNDLARLIRKFAGLGS